MAFRDPRELMAAAGGVLPTDPRNERFPMYEIQPRGIGVEALQGIGGAFAAVQGEKVATLQAIREAQAKARAATLEWERDMAAAGYVKNPDGTWVKPITPAEQATLDEKKADRISQERLGFRQVAVPRENRPVTKFEFGPEEAPAAGTVQWGNPQYAPRGNGGGGSGTVGKLAEWQAKLGQLRDDVKSSGLPQGLHQVAFNIAKSMTNPVTTFGNSIASIDVQKIASAAVNNYVNRRVLSDKGYIELRDKAAKEAYKEGLRADLESAMAVFLEGAREGVGAYNTGQSTGWRSIGTPNQPGSGTFYNAGEISGKPPVAPKLSAGAQYALDKYGDEGLRIYYANGGK